MNVDVSGLGDLYPFESHHITLDGHRLHYVDEGSGPAVLMLHGNPTWSFYYRDLIKALSGTHRVIVPDHMGCGLSDKPQNYPYTLATHIDNVHRLVDHLNVGKVTLVVHDWGGAIGFGWAARNPQKVERFVVFNTAAFFGPCPWRIRICRWPILGDVAVRGLNAFAGSAVYLACKNRPRMTPAVKRGYLLPYRSWADRVAVLQFVRDIPLRRGHKTWPEIERIEASLPMFQDREMMVFWGDRDFCFNDQYLAEWRRRFPKACVHRFPDAGHYVVEDAGDRIIPLVREFLAE